MFICFSSEEYSFSHKNVFSRSGFLFSSQRSIFTGFTARCDPSIIHQKQEDQMFFPSVLNHVMSHFIFTALK